MKLHNNRKLVYAFAPLIILLGITSVFFYKTITRGLVPFPGDLLLSTYAPWRQESYAGYNPGSIPTKGQYFDVVREIYPWKTLAVKQLKKGLIPLWNPYNFSGAPLLANYQSQVFYPYGIVYMFFNQIDAWTILVIVQIVLGLIFMYLFARETGMDPPSAIFTAVLFNFSSFAKAWIEFNTIWHTVIWLPFLLFLSERGIKRKKMSAFDSILFVLSLFSASTAGHPQDFIYILVFAVLYIFLRIWTVPNWTVKDKVAYLLFPNLILFLISLLIASPQLLPTIDLYNNSARVAHDYQNIITNMLVQGWQLPLVAVQDFFGNPATKTEMFGDYINKSLSVGFIGFFFVLVTIFYKQNTWYKKCFLVSSVLFLLVTINSPLTKLLYRYPLPILSTGTPTRILLLFAFTMAMTAGFGLDTFRRLKKPPLGALAAAVITLGILWFIAFTQPGFHGLTYSANAFAVMKRSLLLPSLFTAIFLFFAFYSSKNRLFSFLVIILCVIELFQSFTKFNPFVPKSYIYPENKLISFLHKNTGLNRVWGYGTARIEANFATQEEFYSTDGTDPLNLRWYNQLIQSSKDGNIALVFNRATRSDAQLEPGYGALDLPSNEYRLRLMDLLGVKYVADRVENPKDNDTYSINRFKPVWNENDWTIYENSKVSPRIFVTADIQRYSTIPEFESAVFSENFNPKKTILIHSETELEQILEPGEYSVDINKYEPSQIDLLVKSKTSQLLYTSDTFDPGWKAYVNGEAREVIKANYAFRATVIPPGESLVRFYYLPSSFVRGTVYAALGLAVYLCIIGIEIYSSKRLRK